MSLDRDSEVLELTSDEEEEEKTNGDLCEDLEEALKEGKLGSSVSYAYSSLLPFGPYPCLSINGLGTIGLPLSETEAKRIIVSASQAPYGQGGRTIVNTDVRNTWEIDATRVKLENPSWQGFVQDLTLSVCKNLGVTNYDTPPRCELYKLLLYETGSHFLPHKDSQKADGMFATMIVLLPSRYTGGEVHLTHASKVQVIDFSAPSFANTAVLAWYTNVLHEVKSVTSGYRLALSYNIIHTSRRMPLPAAPTKYGQVTELKRILHKWKKDKYAHPDDPDYVAYLMQHEYNEVELKGGAASLKGEDTQRVVLLRAAAEELDFEIFLANIEYHVTGYADEDDFDYGRAKRRGGHMSTMSDYEKEIDITLSNVVNLNGDLLHGLDTMKISERNLVPKFALSDEEPDDENEEFTGNEGNTLEYWYHRSAIVLIPINKLPQVLIDNGGIEYVMKQFKASLSDNSPTAKDKELADVIIRNIKSASISMTTTMLECAYDWKDLAMWIDVIKGDEQSVGVDGLVRALHVFGFDDARSSIERVVQARGLSSRFEFINAICQAELDQGEKIKVQAWGSNQAALALSSCVSPDTGDVHLLVSMARKNGIQSIQLLPVAKMVPERAFQFLIELVNALHLSLNDILSQTAIHCQNSDGGQSQKQAASLLDDFIRLCLDTITKQWSAAIAQPRRAYSLAHSRQLQLERILKIVELCIVTRQLDACRALLDLVWKAQGDVTSNFDSIYTPLVPRLCKILQKLEIKTCSAPFDKFFCLLISHYLHHILGTKSHNPMPPLRKLGCGCADCDMLDQFMAGNESCHSYGMNKKRRNHLESRIISAHDLVSFSTRESGSPYSLDVKKLPIALSANWGYRLGVVQTFFETIGKKNVEKIMGNRYADVQETLKGLRAFQLDDSVVRQQNPPASVSANATTAVAGRKRKKSDVIIL